MDERGQFSPHGPGGAAGRALLFLAVFLLPLGVSLPMLETRSLFVFRDEYSLLQTAQGLYEGGERGLAAIVFIFSIVVPGLKALVLAGLHLFPPARPTRRALRIIDALGKWSLMDVLVAALVVFSLAGGMASAASLPGLYIFASSAACLILASGLIVKDLERAREAARLREGLAEPAG